MSQNCLYKALRNLPVYRSPRYLAWLKAKHPNKDTHHLTGAMTGIKLCDYICVPVTRAEHIKAEANKSDYCIEHLPEALKNLFDYIKELEND